MFNFWFTLYITLNYGVGVVMVKLGGGGKDFQIDFFNLIPTALFPSNQ